MPDVDPENGSQHGPTEHCTDVVLVRRHSGEVDFRLAAANQIGDDPGRTARHGPAHAKDFEAAVGPIAEVLNQDYDEDFLEDEECLDEPVRASTIETREDWASPNYDEETWDTLTEVLDWIGVSEELKVNFTEKLLTECLALIDPWVFGQAVKDAIEVLEQQKSDFSEGDIITAATHLITSRIRETLESRGESLALYATIKLIVNESNG